MRNIVPKKPPLFVAITGGTSSGKTTLAKALQRKLGDTNAQIISQDNYYQCCGYLPPNERSKLNYDHPSAIDFVLFKRHIGFLSEGQAIQCPLYDFKTHTRKNSCLWIKPSTIIIVEGTLILWDEGLRKNFNYSTFLDIPDDIRLLRRLDRDIEERGRSFKEVRNQYLNTVRPMHIKFIKPCKIHANLIIKHENICSQVNKMSKEIKQILYGR
ncbi:MAG: uridine kinase [Candidatus Hodarchaeota archaeon]